MPWESEVVDGKIYIGEINRIIRLVDSDGDGVFETKETVAELPADDANLSYSYGPIHKDGYLYMALGSPIHGKKHRQRYRGPGSHNRRQI